MNDWSANHIFASVGRAGWITRSNREVGLDAARSWRSRGDSDACSRSIDFAFSPVSAARARGVVVRSAGERLRSSRRHFRPFAFRSIDGLGRRIPRTLEDATSAYLASGCAFDAPRVFAAQICGSLEVTAPKRDGNGSQKGEGRGSPVSGMCRKETEVGAGVFAKVVAK